MSNINNSANACSLQAQKDKEKDGPWPAPRIDEELADKLAAERGVRERPNETLNEIDERGVFVRQPNAFITPFGEKEGEFKAEANRFKIFWAHGCHWSNRPVIVRDILGLEDVIDELATSGRTQGLVSMAGLQLLRWWM